MLIFFLFHMYLAFTYTAPHPQHGPFTLSNFTHRPSSRHPSTDSPRPTATRLSRPRRRKKGCRWQRTDGLLGARRGSRCPCGCVFRRVARGRGVEHAAVLFVIEILR